MPNSIAYAQNYTSILDAVYQRASVSGCLTSGRRIVRAGHNAKEIMIPKIQVTGRGDYVRNQGYKTGSITYEFETKTFNYDRGIRLMVDVMDLEEAGVLDCLVEAGAELQRTQVAAEADAFTFAEIAGHEGVTVESTNYASADAEDVLEDLRTVTSAMDEDQVSTGSRILFITPTLKGILDDFSYANPNRSNRVMERFSRVVEVPQVRFYTAIDLLSGGDDGFGYQKRAQTYKKTTDMALIDGKTYYTKSGDVYTPVAAADLDVDEIGTHYEVDVAGGLDINFMVVERSAVIKFDKHVASRVFSPDELESLDSYMMKYRKYGIVELFDNKLDHVDYDHECAIALSKGNWTLPGKRVQPDCERCHMEHPEVLEDCLSRLRAVHRDCNYLGLLTRVLGGGELRQSVCHHMASANPLNNLLCKAESVKSYL